MTAWHEYQRYRLERVELDGVPLCLKAGVDLEELLRRRDELRDEARLRRRPATVHYFVIDNEDGERGFAEWCDECSLQDPHGTFGSAPCERCRAAAESEPKGLHHA